MFTLCGGHDEHEAAIFTRHISVVNEVLSCDFKINELKEVKMKLD